ncbi:hypothetical protein MCEMSEM23_00732 [Rhabdaerophilaceae bacterium]
MQRFESTVMWWRRAGHPVPGKDRRTPTRSTFRLFFDLIERLERPQPGLETKSLLKRTARISLLSPESRRAP